MGFTIVPLISLNEFEVEVLELVLEAEPESVLYTSVIRIEEWLSEKKRKNLVIRFAKRISEQFHPIPSHITYITHTTCTVHATDGPSTGKIKKNN